MRPEAEAKLRNAPPALCDELASTRGNVLELGAGERGLRAVFGGRSRSDTMIDDLPSESKRVRRLFRERFTFQISVDTSSVPQGLAVAEAALKAGATVLELGSPLNPAQPPCPYRPTPASHARSW
jgi:hypothetical protein